MEHDLRAHLERVRWKLLRAFERMQSEGAITAEQYRQAAELVGQIEHVPVGEVKQRLDAILGLSSEEAA